MARICIACGANYEGALEHVNCPGFRETQGAVVAVRDGGLRHIYPDLREPLRSAAIAAHDALHHLWSKPHGSDYVKSEWKTLEATIERLIALAK